MLFNKKTKVSSFHLLDTECYTGSCHMLYNIHCFICLCRFPLAWLIDKGIISRKQFQFLELLSMGRGKKKKVTEVGNEDSFIKLHATLQGLWAHISSTSQGSEVLKSKKSKWPDTSPKHALVSEHKTKPSPYPSSCIFNRPSISSPLEININY